MREPVDWPTTDLLAHRAAATPERTALIDSETNREWTFRALDTIIDELAARLQADVVTTTDRIGILASTRVGFVATVHATLRTGNAIVPFNLELQDEVSQSQIARVDPDALVCEAATEAQARSLFDGPVLSLDEPDNSDVTPFQPTTGAESGVAPSTWSRDDDAVIMFTSGSTGDSKAVVLTMGNLVASATASAFRLGVSRGDRWLCCLPTYHMGGLAPVFRTALYGRTLVLQQSFAVRETADVMDRYDVTGISFVPTMLHRLLETDWQPSESLETVLLGGAPASSELLTQALERDVPVYPTYGMTETASQIATATPAQVRENPETVGQPLLFTDVSVVDETRTPVERGETGELVVEGPTVARGYLDDEQTAAAFDGGAFKTGDIGRRDEDGLVWVLGRVDDRIVTGGENVHPSEVADALRAHSSVADVAVVGLADEEWGEQIGTLVVPEVDGLTVSAIETHARESLAAYKVPKTIGLATSIPRTASGTVDRTAVRDLLRE